jgi:hydrogenase maturation protein HypF
MGEPSSAFGEEIRIRGQVQGVGFRPTVFRVAVEHGVLGDVCNDGDGVLVHAFGEPEVLDAFVRALVDQCPPLASIDGIHRSPSERAPPASFSIAPSHRSAVRTFVVPDARACGACIAESLDPSNRRYRYPFTNCTHCGPRLSIVRGVPYDRALTSMAPFDLCAACRREYEDPADRRYHAQPNACHACGPRATLTRIDGRPIHLEDFAAVDDVDAASTLLRRGEILAIKGIGGFHLACDAMRPETVGELRRRKQRYRKPFALMARSVDVIRRYCRVTDADIELLKNAAAPIVVMRRDRAESLPDDIAPGQNTLGFMLPYTPLHHLLLIRMEGLIVLTSGNRSDEPQCIGDEEARSRLGGIADYFLSHDRDIVHRLDDSVVRVMANAPRVLRRARGYAPSAIPLPEGFARADSIVAMGAELKNTFCVLKDGAAILSQHIGDLEHASALADYWKNLELYRHLFQHAPSRVAVDRHPDYLSTQLGKEWAEREGLAITAVQHHHAHIASCLADQGWPLDGGRVLGVALDGLGLGDGGELWGGEFLLADYGSYERLGTFKPVAMLGGSQAMREPWRNLYAHIVAEMGWAEFKKNFGGLELRHFLESKALGPFDAMLRTRTCAPLASSCGRMFDAVAAALGVCRDSASYEGQAAVELEALVEGDALSTEDDRLAYPFDTPRLGGSGLAYVEPLAMWRALFADLVLDVPRGVMAARFHKGLARVIVSMVKKLSQRGAEGFVRHVALSGGVFQNKVLLEQVVARLEAENFHVLTHRRTPANDGGIALGQAVIAAARRERAAS